MPKYYATGGGYYYKKTKNGKATRISLDNYNKAMNKKMRGGGNTQSVDTCLVPMDYIYKEEFDTYMTSYSENRTLPLYDTAIKNIIKLILVGTVKEEENKISYEVESLGEYWEILKKSWCSLALEERIKTKQKVITDLPLGFHHLDAEGMKLFFLRDEIFMESTVANYMEYKCGNCIMTADKEVGGKYIIRFQQEKNDESKQWREKVVPQLKRRMGVSTGIGKLLPPTP